MITCPKCGSLNPDGSKFCATCGEVFTPDMSQPSASAQGTNQQIFSAQNPGQPTGPAQNTDQHSSFNAQAFEQAMNANNPNQYNAQAQVGQNSSQPGNFQQQNTQYQNGGFQQQNSGFQGQNNANQNAGFQQQNSQYQPNGFQQQNNGFQGQYNVNQNAGYQQQNNSFQQYAQNQQNAGFQQQNNGFDQYAQNQQFNQNQQFAPNQQMGGFGPTQAAPAVSKGVNPIPFVILGIIAAVFIAVFFIFFYKKTISIDEFNKACDKYSYDYSTYDQSDVSEYSTELSYFGIDIDEVTGLTVAYTDDYAGDVEYFGLKQSSNFKKYYDLFFGFASLDDEEKIEKKHKFGGITRYKIDENEYFYLGKDFIIYSSADNDQAAESNIKLLKAVGVE